MSCAFCSGVTDLVELERLVICQVCAATFEHQLGHAEGSCSNCGKGVPVVERLHGEHGWTVCDACLDRVLDGSGTPNDPAAQAPSAPVPLTHLTDSGEVHMVDVGSKPATERLAVAEAVVSMPAELADRFFTGDLPKGDALATVRIAAITASKRTPDLIPLAHPLALTSVEVSVGRAADGVRIEVACRTTGPTGVEIEALVAASVGALTLYDMVKSIERGVVIGPIRLLSKSGGRSGDWAAAE